MRRYYYHEGKQTTQWEEPDEWANAGQASVEEAAAEEEARGEEGGSAAEGTDGGAAASAAADADGGGADGGADGDAVGDGVPVDNTTGFGEWTVVEPTQQPAYQPTISTDAWANGGAGNKPKRQKVAWADPDSEEDEEKVCHLR